MSRRGSLKPTLLLCGLLFGLGTPAASGAESPAAPQVDFHREVLPILSRHCARCHTSGKHEGGLAIDNRQKLLAGGDSGPALVVGKSDKSLLIGLVSGRDPEKVMPAEGRKLTADEIGTLRSWIDQGAPWEEGLSLSAFPTASWEPRRVELPPAPAGAAVASNPIDRLLAPYFAHHKIAPPAVVSDRVFARRAYLDLVGLMPSHVEIEAFEKDSQADKRRALVQRLLASREQYAIHWMSFWNDALRNDYKGPGYIDGGRKQITGWLYKALAENKPFDQFVRELVAPPNDESAGFVKGIVWRGVVNASQRPEMQAAQHVSQVFLGINLKCASCHDSFVSEWKLDDAYALASVFADKPLEVHRCDAPLKRTVEPRFLSAKLGKVDPKASLPERRKQVAEILTSPQDGRLARTIVNRLWARLLGRGLVEPVDSMDNPPWNAELLDFLATDLVDHKYDLQHTLELILTSQAYQLPSVGATSATEKDFVFRGPLVKRVSAEQFIDAVSTITGVWQPANGFKPPKKKAAAGAAPDFSAVGIRSALAIGDPLARALGRPNREQVITSREPVATTLQVLELTNGTTLDKMLKQGAERRLKESPGPAEGLIEAVYLRALMRRPEPKELETARGLVGTPATPDGVQDLMWTLMMLPEFQLIE
ncbi:MAG: PSD1 and planctomycete cytochrome C domain-containing protein [Planctomycetia bacterium]|nr:PSD1 and planctomycete cytochrome C domain-containing protein [Planctomycetia bacterium]